MNKKIICIVIAILITSCSDKQSNRSKPNVLFIAIDDLNACGDGMNGETSVPTPNIGKLASKGILFTNAYCAAPACNPSRTAVLTGLAPSSSGVYLNSQDWRLNDKLKNWPTIPHHFKEHGYKTMGGGKIYHAASLSTKGYTGNMDPRPWDEYYPNKQRQMPDEVLPPEGRAVHTNRKFYGGRFDWAELNIEADQMADAKVVSWAEKQLSQKHEKPLFLAVGIYRPHIPWYTPKEYYEKHPIDKVVLPDIKEDDLNDVPEIGKNSLKNDWHKWIQDHNQWKHFVRGYNASVSFTDDMIGRLINALESGPNADNTIVVLWSDHGYHLGQKQHWEKFALWEQTTRVPFIISTPGKSKHGERCNQAVSLLDIYPTLCDLCGIKPDVKLDGESLTPLLLSPHKRNNRSIITTHGFKNHAVRSENWRYIRYENGAEELYNQIDDPKNFTNLANEDQYKKIKEELKKHLPQTNAINNPKGVGKQKNKK